MPGRAPATLGVMRVKEDTSEVNNAYHGGQKQSGIQEAAYHGRNNALFKIQLGPSS